MKIEKYKLRHMLEILVEIQENLDSLIAYWEKEIE